MEHKFLIEKRACKDGMTFASKYESLREAWDNCNRGDWMCWYAEKAGVDKRTLTLVAGLCAETVIHLMNDERSINAVKSAIAYGKGEIIYEDLEAARSAAWSAMSAAWAAARSAEAAAAAALSVAAEAAWSAAARSAADANKKQTAEICRKYLTDIIKWK